MKQQPKIIDIREVAARMKIVTLTTGVWSATRLHKRETQEVNEKHGTGQAARVRVRQTDHAALTAIYREQAAARIEHNSITAPSVQDGVRILPVGREFDHSARMRKRSDVIQRHLGELCADYWNERTRQEQKLNGLFQPQAWPNTIEELRAEFVFQTRYLPCPTDGAWEEWLGESARAADAEIEERLRGALERVADRCANDGRLYKTVFTSLREIIDLVPDFDLEGKYANVVEAAKEIAKFDADEIHDDKKARKQIARKAEEILSAFGGGTI